MTHDYPTDEDRQIARLIIHRNLVGWVVQALAEAGIEAVRTSGNDVSGDVRLCSAEDIAAAKNKLRAIQFSLHGTASQTSRTQAMNSVYIEVKAYAETTVTSGLARKLVQKETILGVVTTSIITGPAKKLFDEADIAWIENFPESLVQDPKS